VPRNTSGLKRGGPGRPKRVPNKATADVKAAAQGYTVETVEALVAIMRDTDAPPAARVAVCKEIFDRAHGRPAQAIATKPRCHTHRTHDDVDPRSGTASNPR
jgi:hypothetical protein